MSRTWKSCLEMAAKVEMLMLTGRQPHICNHSSLLKVMKKKLYICLLISILKVERKKYETEREGVGEWEAERDSKGSK